MLRNQLKYLLLLGAVGLLAILYNTYYMGILFLAVLGMPFFMLLLLFYTYANVGAKLVSAAHIVNRREPVPITVQMRNSSFFPVTGVRIYLTYQNAYSNRKYKTEYMVSLDARTNTQVTVSLKSEHAGNLVISLKAIRVYDYLKLFSLRKKQSGEIKAAVLPSYYELTEMELSGSGSELVDSDTYSTTKSGDDPSEIFAIREYREGDRLQRIHWKLSRKQDQLMIKEFSDPVNCSILLLVDLSTRKERALLPFADALLECTLSLSYTLLLHKQIHYLAWYDVKYGGCTRIRISQEKELFDAVDALLQAKFYSSKGSGTGSRDVILNYMAEYPRDQYTEVFYMTGEVKAVNPNSMALFRTRECHLLYIHDDEEQEELLEQSVLVQEYGGGFHVEFWPVDLNNSRQDLEELIVGSAE
ncbi:MAG TPA: DUF58 domain-containing protein [Clostridiales bacterium]|nr:DUF58 domain-containing protein [Clostridiales bacterium]